MTTLAAGTRASLAAGARNAIANLYLSLSTTQRWLVALVLLFSLAVYWPGLVASLWIDDTLRTFSSHVPMDQRWQWLLTDAHNPLYNVFMLGWIHLFGDGEATIRLPTVVAAYATALVLFAWANKRFDSWIALTAATLFLINPATILHATMAKNNLFTVFFALLALISIDLLRTQPRHRWTILALASATLGLYTDWGVLVLLLPAWLMLALSATWPTPRPSRLDPKLVLLVIGLPLAAIAPLLLYKLDHPHAFERPYLRHFDLRELWQLLFNWMLWGNALRPANADRVLITTIGTILALPLLVAGLARLRHSPTGRLLAVAFILPLLATLAVSAVLQARFPDGGRYIFQERNLLPLLPVLMLILAVGGFSLRPRWLGRPLLAALVVANLAGSVLIWTIWSEKRVVYWPRRDFRAMSAEIVSIAEAAPEPIVLVSIPPAGPLRYYLRGVDGVKLERSDVGWTGLRHVNRFARRHGASELYLLTLDDEPRRLRRRPIERHWSFHPLVERTRMTLYRLERKPRLERSPPAGNAPNPLPSRRDKGP